MATLGETLKEEREKARINLERAADTLKVGKEYLINVENDYYEELPPDVYIKGFLRNYARLLDLDENEVIKIYQKQKEITQQKIEAQSGKKKKQRLVSKFIITPQLIFGIISVAFLMAIVIYFFKATENFSEAPFLEIAEPLENETVNDERLTIRGKTDPESSLEINGQAINLDKDGIFVAEVTLMEGINEIIIKAKNKFNKEAKKDIIVNYERNQIAEELFQKFKIINLKVESEPVWIEVTSSTETFSETLAAYSEKILEIKEETTVTVSKANGIYFTEDKGNLEIFGETNERGERIFSP